MTTKVRVWIASATLAVVAGLIYVSGTSLAGSGKELRTEVIKVGEMIRKGNSAGAQTTAAGTAKKITDLADLMHMFKPRNKDGLGVGDKPVAGVNPAKDGIEVMIRDVARDGPTSALGKQTENLETTGYWIVAMAELTKAKGWSEKDKGQKSKKNWEKWAGEMRAAGVAFAKAGTGKGESLQKAAKRVNDSCSGCHSIFKE